MKRKIIAYDILSSSNDYGLTSSVNRLIEEGWQPHGSPFGYSTYMYQAMVKYEE